MQMTTPSQCTAISTYQKAPFLQSQRSDIEELFNPFTAMGDFSRLTYRPPWATLVAQTIALK